MFSDVFSRRELHKSKLRWIYQRSNNKFVPNLNSGTLLIVVTSEAWRRFIYTNTARFRYRLSALCLYFTHYCLRYQGQGKKTKVPKSAPANYKYTLNHRKVPDCYRQHVQNVNYKSRSVCEKRTLNWIETKHPRTGKFDRFTYPQLISKLDRGDVSHDCEGIFQLNLNLFIKLLKLTFFV